MLLIVGLRRNCSKGLLSEAARLVCGFHHCDARRTSIYPGFSQAERLAQTLLQPVWENGWRKRRYIMNGPCLPRERPGPVVLREMYEPVSPKHGKQPPLEARTRWDAWLPLARAAGNVSGPMHAMVLM